MKEFHHVSVLLNEVIEGLNIKSDGIYVDGTLGGAGHSKEILKHLGSSGKLIGIDQDTDALGNAGKQLAAWKDQVILLQGNFRNMTSLLESVGIEKVDGILLDLGVSSYQLDTADRGFSYHQEGPLDMRMDRSAGLSANEVVNEWEEAEIVKILFEYGEEKFARRIGKKIVEYRKQKPIETTLELAEIIKEAIPAATRRNGPHPAKRSFQAIRIAVNQELEILKETFVSGVNLLNIGGRMGVITFHSLEDRITKKVFREMEHPCICPPQLPICGCGRKPQIKSIGKVQSPGIEELAKNPRARSAKLRVVEKI